MSMSNASRGRSVSTMPTHPSLSQYQYQSLSQSVASTNSNSADVTSFPVPMIVRSTISVSTHKYPENVDDVLKLQNVPLSPEERPFLQCEIPIYLGPVKHYEVASPDSEYVNGRQREINFFNVMSIDDMCNKSRNGGFSRYDKIDLLNQVFPPREFVLEKNKWRLDISKVPASSTDRMNLFKKFETETNSKNCSRKGFCPIMNDMIQDLFDECIRQDILENPERGLLLAGIKNGLNRQALTLSALLENSQMKVGRVTATLGAVISQLNKAVEKDEMETANLEAKIHDLEQKMEGLKVRHHDERKREQSKNHAELEYQKKFCAQAKEQVELFEDPEHHKHSSTKSKGSAHHHHGSTVDARATAILRASSAV